MQIKQLAQSLNISAETIRYYERDGLLPEPARAENGYRQYGLAHVKRLTFIANCRALEMSHEEIRALLQAQDDSAADCEPIQHTVQHHLQHVRARIRRLQSLAKSLEALNKRCTGNTAVDACEIVAALSEPTAQPVRPQPRGVH